MAKTTAKKPAAKPAKPNDQRPDEGVIKDAAPAPEADTAASTHNTPEGLAPATADAPPPPDAAGVAAEPAADDVAEVLDFDLFPEPPDGVLSYRVISPLRHDGKRYKVGDLVNLAGPQAARLIGLRVVTTEPAEG